jgi:hypothetical protein
MVLADRQGALTGGLSSQLSAALIDGREISVAAKQAPVAGLSALVDCCHADHCSSRIDLGHPKHYVRPLRIPARMWSTWTPTVRTETHCWLAMSSVCAPARPAPPPRPRAGSASDEERTFRTTTDDG